MSRKVFDVLTSAGGALVVVVLVVLVAGGLLTWGHSFVNSNVHDQLAQQQIFFPPKAAFAHAQPRTEITPAMIPSVSQYAGQQLLSDSQAEAYANHFIAVHLSELPFGGVYAKISSAALAQPTYAKLTALKQTSFQGTTLRGLLLEAYAVREDRPDHVLGRNRILHPRRSHARARRPRFQARSSDAGRGADAHA
jgi:hypothetical protein